MISQIPTNAADRFQLECTESAFEALFNKCYIKALAPNLPSITNPEILTECVNYSTQVLKNAGGIKLLTDAIENAKTPANKSFLQNFCNACVEAGNEMALSILTTSVVTEEGEPDASMQDPAQTQQQEAPAAPAPEETDEDPNQEVPEEEEQEPEEIVPEMPKIFKGKEINDIQLDTKITDKELDSLKSAAAKVNIDNISTIVSDKVANVLQAEKVNRYKINEEKERLKQAIIDDPSNSAEDDATAESVMQTMLEVPLDKVDSPVYNSFFSTLQRRVMESVLVYGNTDTQVADILTEITANETLPIFTPVKMSFQDACTRAIEMTVATESLDPAAMQDIAAKATTFATMIYTLIEMLNTTGLHKCTTGEVKCVMNKDTAPVSPTNDVVQTVNAGVEPAIERYKKRILGMNTCEQVNKAIENIKALKGKLAAARENTGMRISDNVFSKLDELIDFGSKRAEAIEQSLSASTESAMIDTVSRVREADIGRLDSVARVLKYKNYDNVVFRCLEATNTEAAFAVDARLGNSKVYSTTLNVAGMEAVEPEAYMNYILKKSKLHDIAPNKQTPDFCVVHNGKKTIIG